MKNEKNVAKKRNNDVSGIINDRIFSDTLKLLVLHKKFLNEVSNIRKRFDIPENGYKTLEECEDWLNAKGELDLLECIRNRSRDDYPTKRFYAAIDSLLQLFKLPYPFQQPILDYIFLNYFPKQSLIECKKWEMLGKNPSKSHPVITVQIYTRLSKDEMMRIMRAADKKYRYHFPSYSKRFLPYRQIDRDIKILTLTKQKTNDSNIRTDLDLVALLFAENEDQSPKTDKRRRATIQTARKRLKARLLKRFPSDTFGSQ